MRWLWMMGMLVMTLPTLVVFDASKPNKKLRWFQTNDDVMGGISSSTMKVNEAGVAEFSGRVSTENNGGFAMTRLPVSINFDQSYSKIVLLVQGDGKPYQFRLKASKRQRFWYVQKFTTSGEIEKIELPLKDFYPSWRGYRLNSGNFDATQLTELALLIGNKKNESFTLLVHKITLE
jgi:hypothetical protein